LFQISLLSSVESISTIKAEWAELYENNSELSPYQSFEWNIALIENGTYGGTINYYCLYKQGKMILIAPFVKRGRVVFQELRFLGEETHADYLNFIYHQNLQYEDFYYFINELINARANVILHLNLLHSSSRISSFVDRLPFGQRNYCIPCVKVPIWGSIDEFHTTLSKRVKSKVRRSISRLENSLLEVEYRFVEDRQLQEEAIDEVLQLYINHSLELRREVNIKSVNAVKQYLRDTRQGFLAECYIDGEIAAVFLGFVSPNGTICSPITAYKSIYKEYSIGIVLLYKTICFLINQNKQVKYFDLTRGTEEYKFKIGGIQHNCRTFILSKTRAVACLALYVPYFSCQCKSQLRNQMSRLCTCLMRGEKKELKSNNLHS